MTADVAAQKLSQFLYATSNFMALPIEKSFEPMPYVNWMGAHWHVAAALVIGYVTVIFGGQHIMKDYKPFDLRLALASWNALLCVFSFMGMCRTVPYLLAQILSKSFEQTVCEVPTSSWGVGPSGFWVMLFIFSKIPELIDTVFIVLRKRPLIFLHWYHHVTVLLFCWSAYATISGSGLYFVAMNYSVHALMYGYYCLQALNVCPKSFPAILITLSQIAQMFVGTGVCVSSWYFVLSGHTCGNDMSNLIAGALMYGSYLYLFTEFAIRRYAGPKAGKKEGKKIE